MANAPLNDVTLVAKSLSALGASPFEPLADRTGCHTEGQGNLALFPALLCQVPSPEPAIFSPVVGMGAGVLFHTQHGCTFHAIFNDLCSGR
jgi:hypothetical protein